jgi:hypothetical protein
MSEVKNLSDADALQAVKDALDKEATTLVVLTRQTDGKWTVNVTP